MDIYLDLLLGIKLQGGAKIEYIIEEVDTSKYEPVALIYFKNQHWVPVNTDFFKCFITHCFPNLPNPSDLIKALCSQNHSKLYNEKREVSFKCWVNQLPFKNGVFDFEYLRKLLDKHAAAATTAAANLRNRKRLNIDSMQQQHQQKRLKCDFSVESEEALVENLSLCKKAIPILDDLRRDFNAEFTLQDLDEYDNISIFRNYTEEDAVLSPIDKVISIDYYLNTFFNTPLLSLENTKRYSAAFCTYMKCLLGNNAHEARMGVFQYMRLMVLFSFLGQSFMRTKVTNEHIFFC